MTASPTTDSKTDRSFNIRFDTDASGLPVTVTLPISEFSQWVLKRMLWTVFATWLILTVTFGMIAYSPNPTADAYVASQVQNSQGDTDVEAIQEAYRNSRGLDQSLSERYIGYIKGIVTLDWGWSQSRGQYVLKANWQSALDTGRMGQAAANLNPVGVVNGFFPTIYGAIPDAWVLSLLYGVPAVVISTILGLAIGLYSAIRQHTKFDYGATSFAFFGLSIPDFWFALLFLSFFGFGLGWVPVPPFDRQVPLFSMSMAMQLIGPALILGLSSIAGLMRYTRAESLEQVNKTFVKTAKSKGAGEIRVLLKHIFRPALIPLSTVLVTDILGIILTASYLIEVVFGIPGLGRLSLKAIQQQDTGLVLGTVLIPTFIALFGNFLQDVAYQWLDPRIDFGSGGGN